MKLNVNFDKLNEVVEQMGAQKRNFNIQAVLPNLIDIDTKLRNGIQVSISDVKILDNGLLSYKSRQVLLYIQDHGWKVKEALENGTLGKKYHLSYCQTLKDMELRGKYDRYVVKNNINNNFLIDGKDDNGRYIKGETTLNVCKKCLAYLDYNGYKQGNKENIFQTFSQEEFFNKYKKYFKDLPKYSPGEKSSEYPDNWSQISKKYRISVNWICEKCQVDLKDDHYLLDTHHINGVKHDCKNSNLKALCKECHANEPNHSHMKIDHNDKILLQKLKTEQDIQEYEKKLSFANIYI